MYDHDQLNTNNMYHLPYYNGNVFATRFFFKVFLVQNKNIFILLFLEGGWRLIHFIIYPSINCTLST